MWSCSCSFFPLRLRFGCVSLETTACIIDKNERYKSVSEVVGDDHVVSFPVVVSFERLAKLAIFPVVLQKIAFNKKNFRCFCKNLHSTKNANRIQQNMKEKRIAGVQISIVMSKLPTLYFQKVV